ncbi:MAG: uroporphyrinogen decarboxylase family protein [Methanomassiliicoccales archaeon]
MTEEMTPRQRFEAAANFETPDYVPASLFGGIFETHFVDGMTVPDFGMSGENMGKAHIAFYEEIGGDTIYCLSDMGLIVQGWGVKMKMPDEPDIHMALGEFAVKEPEDWEKLEVLDPEKDGRMHLYLDACRMCSDKYGDKVPIGVSLPSPVTTATHVCSMEDVLVHMMTDPDALKKGLQAIQQTIADFINACYDAGACYTGYLTTRASKEITTEDQYREFGAPSDEFVFKNTPDMMHWPHICGVEPMFDVVNEYATNHKNVKGISWWDRGATPNLKEAKEGWGDNLCIMAGVDHTDTLTTGSAADIEREVKEACQWAMEGSGFILAPGCEISPKTPWDNMRTYFKAARKYGKY